MGGDSHKANKGLRETLVAIRDQNGPDHQAGPRAQGMQATDWLVVGSFFDAAHARLFQDALGKAGVGSTSATRDRRTHVSVEYEDREAAAAILTKHLQTHPNRRPPGIRRDYDGLIFGFAIGLTTGFIFALGANFAVIVPFVLLGMLIGHLYDRMRYHLRASGRLRIGIWELLVLATLPAAVSFLWLFIGETWTRP